MHAYSEAFYNDCRAVREFLEQTVYPLVDRAKLVRRCSDNGRP